MKISKNKLLNLISEAVEEHINQLAYPEKAHDPGDSLPIISKQKPYERRKEPILQKLRRSIFNAMSNSEGVGREYSIEDISKDISSRYGVPYDEVYDVAVKCLKSRIASGEADYCVSELPPKKKDSQLRVYKKVDESALQKIVSESVKKVLKEVSDRTAADALGHSDNYIRVLNAINEKFKDLQDSLADIADCGWNSVKPVNNEAKLIYDDLSVVFERFRRFYARKQNQYNSFEDEYIQRGSPEID